MNIDDPILKPIDPTGVAAVLPTDAPAAPADGYDQLAQAQPAEQAATPRGNEYDAVIVDLDRARDTRARTNILAAQGASPDGAAKALDMERRTGIPAATIERDPAAVRGQAEVGEYADLAARHGGLARWLGEDPVNARVAGDDYASLGLVERTWNELRRVFHNTKTDVNAAAAAIGGRQVRDLNAAEEKAKRGEFLSPFEREQVRQGTEARANALQGRDQAIDTLLTARKISDEIPMRPALRELNEAKTWGDAWGALMKDPLGIIYDLTVQSAPQLVGTTAALVFGGVPTAVVVTGATSFGQEFLSGVLDNLEDMGVDTRDPEKLRWAFSDEKTMRDVWQKSAIKGAIVGSFDAGTLGVAGKVLAPSAVKTMVGKEAINIPAQLALQMAGGAGGEALGSVAAGREVKPGAVLAEAAGELGGAPAEVAGARHAVAGDKAIRERERFRALPVQEQQATVALAGVDRLIETAQATKLATRSPSKLEEFLNTLAGATEDRDVFVPAGAVQSYLQSLPVDEAERQARALGIDTQLPEAIARGGDVVIPLAKYVIEAGRTDAHAAWREDMRLEADGFSLRQAKEDAKVAQERMKAAVARFEEQIEAGVSTVDATTRVFEDFRERLRTAGQFTNEVADQYAALYAERYAARAAANPHRYGDAWEAYQQAGTGRGVDVQSVVPDGVRAYPPDTLDVLLNAMRSGKPLRTAKEIRTAKVLAGIPRDFTPDKQVMGQARRLARGWSPEKPAKAPQSLAAFVRAAGGLNIKGSEAGDIRAADLGKIRGLLQRKGAKTGHSIDTLGQMAADAGFRIGEETTYGSGVDAKAFLEALIEDASGRRQHYPDDAETAGWQAQQAYLVEYARWLQEDAEWDPTGRDPREIAWFLSQDGGAQRLMALAERVDSLDEKTSLEALYLLDGELAKIERETLDRLAKMAPEEFEASANAMSLEEWEKLHAGLEATVGDRGSIDRGAGQGSAGGDAAGSRGAADGGKPAGGAAEEVSEPGRGEVLGHTAERFTASREELAKVLDALGIDVKRMNNVQVRKALKAAVDAERGGRTLSQDATPGTPAFDQWFDGSKVVDGNGKPLVMYHGTNQNFDAFSAEKLGSHTNTVSAKGFFFSDSPVEASEYAAMSARRQVSNADEMKKESARLLKAMARAEARGDWALQEKLTLELEANEEEAMTGEERGANVLPVYLAIKNPMVLDMKSSVDLTVIEAAIEAAKQQGHDGLLLKNVFDAVADRPEPFDTTQWVAFEPTQVKSIFNRGTFDADDARLLYQGPLPAGFDKWFGSSVVKDDLGRPLIVYRGEHGLGEGDVETRVGSISFGTAGTASIYAMQPNDRSETAERPRVMPAYLRIERPIINDRSGDPFIDMSVLVDALGQDEAIRIALKFANDIENTSNWLDDIKPTGDYYDVADFLKAHPDRVGELYLDVYPLLDDPDVVAKLKAAGFDGAIHGGNGETALETEYRVFDQSQIKSPFNQGSFDAKDPRILYQGAARPYLNTGGHVFTLGTTSIRYSVQTSSGIVEVNMIRTAYDSLRQGEGRRAMEALLAATDDAGMTVFLTPEPMDKPGISKRALTAFYKSLGFVPNSGGKRDFRSRETMRREPAGDTLYQSPFYSAALRAAEGLTQAKGTGEQMLAALRKSAGVRKEEIEWLGVDAFLAGKKGVTKAEVVDYIRANQVDIREVIKGGLPIHDDGNSSDLMIEEMEDGTYAVFYEREPIQNLMGFATFGEADAAASAWKESDAARLRLLERDNPNQYAALRDVGITPVMSPDEAFLMFQDLDGETFMASEMDVDAYGSDAFDAAWHLVHALHDGAGGATQFHGYTLPGGQQYRELLITMPGRNQTELQHLDDALQSGNGPYGAAERNRRIELEGQAFRSGHFNEPNILAHIRFDDRTDADGKRVLFLEEIQSDWHQTGRDKGYDGPKQREALAARVTAAKTRLADEFNAEPANVRTLVNIDTGDAVSPASNPGLAEAWLEYTDAVFAQTAALSRNGSVPDAPLKKTWHETAFRRAVAYAAAGGYDRVAWTTGQQQAERYDLSKQVSSVALINGPDVTPDGREGTHMLLVYDKAGSQVHRQGVTEQSLQEVIGKEAAEKLLTAKPKNNGDRQISGLDLRMGGEGMKAFYDKMLPNYARDFGKKFGAKVSDIEIPVDKEGWHLTPPDRTVSGKWMVKSSDYNSVGLQFDSEAEALQALAEKMVGAKVHSLEITDDMRQSVEGGVPLFQSARGSISFGDNATIIRLFQGRDLSTLLHETGHLMLEELEVDARDPKASEQVKADWSTVLAYLGSADGYITTEQHELFARSMEAYLMEGKAPSLALASAFRRFKNWLVQIYRRLAALDAPISDEMRKVFDRLLATDEQIQIARETQELNPIFKDAKSAGMTDQAFQAYTRAANAAIDSAEQEALAKTMASIRKERTRDWKDQEHAMKIAITEEVMSDPGQAALHLLTKGKTFKGETPAILKDAKLDRDEVVRLFGDEQVLEMLPSGTWKIGGTSADLVAAGMGLADGRDLVERLMKLAADRQEMRARGDNRTVAAAQIAEQLAARMKEAHGDPLNDGTIEAEAMAAVHSDRQAALMASELRVLARKAGQGGAITLKDIEAWAAGAIDAKRSGDAVKFEAYLRAERLAGQRVERALVKGDFLAAFKAKQDQLVNHALYRAAKDAAREVDRARKAMDRYAGARTLKAMDQDYLEQIHGLLERFDFKSVSNAELERRASFAEWAIQAEADGIDVVAPEKFMNAAYRQNYRDMTLEELRALYDTVQQLAHLGRKKKELLDNGKKRAFEAVKVEALETMEKLTQRGVDLSQRGKTALQKKMGIVGETLRNANTSLLKLETIFNFLDGDETGKGVFNRVVFKRISEAQTVEYDLQVSLNKSLLGLYQALPKERLEQWREILTLPELLRNGEASKLSKAELIALALNTGNDSNFDKLLRGEKWDAEAVKVVLDKHLDRDDWKFIQGAWDLIETLWPQIAEMERRVNGVAPKRVEPRTVETPYGPHRGGYYPLMYDPRISIDVEQREAKTTDGLFDKLFTRATTPKGFTKSRTEGYAKPLHLSLEVLPRHLTEVAHDIAFREAIMDAHKFLMNPEILAGVDSAVGREYSRQFLPWLQHIANEWAADRRGAQGLEKVLRTTRLNTTMVGMGLRISTMLSQVWGISNSAEMIGALNVGKGVLTFVQNPAAAARYVYARSGEMRHRANDLERDIRDNNRKHLGETGFAADVRRFAFRGIALFDLSVTIPTWIGAYNKALKEGMADGEAAFYADKAVRQTQGAGSAKDLAAVTRNGEVMKLFTMFYSYFSAMYNRQVNFVRDAREADLRDIPDLAARAFWLLILPALGSAWTSGQGPGEDEDWGAWALRKAFFNLFMGVPGIRDIASGAERMIAGEYSRGAQLLPITQLLETVFYKVPKDVAGLVTGEVADKAAVKTAFNAAGYLMALPLGQVGATAQFLYDVADGSQNPEGVREWLSGLVYGPKPKK